MKAAIDRVTATLRNMLRRTLHGPQALAFLPALTLAAFWLGGEATLILAALGLPLLFVFAGGRCAAPSESEGAAPAPDQANSATAARLAATALDRARGQNLSTGCMLIEIDGFREIAQRSGDAAAEALRDLTLERLRNLLRRDDLATRLNDRRFLILLGPAKRLDLESLLQLATRLQTGVEEPATIHNAPCYLTASVGFCGSARLAPDASGEDMLDAARVAVGEAAVNGPSAIRAWSDGMSAAHLARKSLLADVEKALANGQVQPWFQPQLCTSTGRISGVEALARWIHPDRGIIPPAQFLRCLEEAGQMSHLAETILQHSLTALRGWDRAGLDIPRVSVNFSGAELRDPHLVDRIGWELDRFGFTPVRLGVEILETVIAGTQDDVVSRNITALDKLGCQIDLDDFGTGHASITSLRRFPVTRLKIDRSFVTRVDRDEEQRRMIAAVLGMADRLGLGTLAEGVETVGEHALVAQLGCDHVQGYGLARPMPGDRMVAWAESHAERIADAQKLGRNTG